MLIYPKFKVAAMHVSPEFLDREKTIDKVCSLITEAARNGAKLAVFPEAFVPAFPLWSSVRAPIFNHKFFARLAHNTVLLNGPGVRRVCNTARANSILVSLGINEGTLASAGCIWNANILVDENGTIINHRRKIVPTFFEKLTWANGDGYGLDVVSTSIGRTGVLLCGENGNPLARFAMMAQGEQVHIANYPPLWPNGAKYSLLDAIKIRAQAHCIEGKLFTVVSSSFLRDEDKALIADGDTQILDVMNNAPRTASMVVGPNGEILGNVQRDEEGIVYADIDVEDVIIPKQFHDVVGYYNRFDIFKLTVNRSRNRPATFEDSDDANAVNRSANDGFSGEQRSRPGTGAAESGENSHSLGEYASTL